MKIISKLIPSEIKRVLKIIIFKSRNRTVRLNGKSNISLNTKMGLNCSLGPFTKLDSAIVGDYTYFAGESTLYNVEIGSFCSIGPGCRIGLGSHPTDLISTSPIFYSTLGQLPEVWTDKPFYEELKPITIENNVWIGANVTVLDGIKIGEGAICAAGSVVNKDVPPYSIVGGVPAKIIKYRFDEDVIKEILRLNLFSRDRKWLKENMVGLITPDKIFEKFKGTDKN